MSDQATTLVRVTLPGACFGIEVDPLGRVVRAAPIGRWMVGKHASVIRAWAARKGGSTEEEPAANATA